MENLAANLTSLVESIVSGSANIIEDLIHVVLSSK